MERAVLKEVIMDTRRYKTRQQKALDAAYARAQAVGPVRTLDIACDRYVIFSDLHRGARNGADDFWACERAYNAALAYYLQLGYFLIVLGDVEELWEERPQPVLEAYKHSLELEAQFHQAGRYLRIWGNHDDEWQYADSVARHLAPVFGTDPPLQVRESALIRALENGRELGDLFLIHGHQGDRLSDTPSRLPRFAVRYIWRPLQRLLRLSRNTPAYEWELTQAYDTAMYAWARRQDGLVLIAGHTHRPVFKSASHVVQLQEKLARLAQVVPSSDGQRQKIVNARARLLAKLEWVMAQSYQKPREEASTLITVPCYFNTGCCCFSDGDITGLEIADGEIRLIRWPDKQGEPLPLTLKPAALKGVLDKCHYVPAKLDWPDYLPPNRMPVIDVHDHSFRGADIPLKGYLLARKYDQWFLQLKPVARFVFSRVAACIREQSAEERRFFCRQLLKLVYKTMGQSYRNWADILSMPTVREVVRELVETFDKDGIELYVPLLIDYAYWFEYSGEPHIVEQIAYVRDEIVLPYRGLVHPFVPFDPARELAYQHGIPGPDGQPERHSSMALVREAILDGGFIGVKLYNTLGYRPLGNASVEEHRRRIYRDNRLKRYLEADAQKAFAGEEFDRVLRELYRFCAEEQVPITAHCLSNGIEAYAGASADFAWPRFWEDVFAEFPELHVNLAHFGWDHAEGYYPASTLWGRVLGPVLRRLGREEAKTWVREISEMLEPHPYLFVDVAHHGVTEPRDRNKFKKAYVGMCADLPPGVLQRRLLFGIDWHVIARVPGYAEFKTRYVELLHEAEVFPGEQIRDFLGGNALRFLGLLPLGTSPGWTRNRERLAAFYQRNQIAPPRWFTVTAEASAAASARGTAHPAR
jgi:predicted TIM-barrel fold metal-dependent hydrolase/UDP-2,3-diacylglucosamine pyrophosphatase LpxH